MKRRAIVLVMLASFAAFGIVAACGFPDVEFIAGDGDGSTIDAPATDGPADGKPVGANEDVDPNGADADATTAPDAQRIDAGPDATCCDCDGDKVNRSTGGCSLPTGDCDDTNPFVFKGQTFVDTTVWDTDHLPLYDWDCNGSAVKQYGHSIPACNGRLSALGCAAAQGGFLGDPGCGIKGHFVTTCIADPASLNLNCKEGEADDRKQGCH